MDGDSPSFVADRWRYSPGTTRPLCVVGVCSRTLAPSRFASASLFLAVMGVGAMWAAFWFCRTVSLFSAAR
jgi:hypothetical protein